MWRDMCGEEYIFRVLVVVQKFILYNMIIFILFCCICFAVTSYVDVSGARCGIVIVRINDIAY